MDADTLVARVLAGDPPTAAALDALSATDRARAVTALLADPAGRRWLRALPGLDAALAERLLEYDTDFSGPRRDATLARAIAAASAGALRAHAGALAAGSGASALWARLAETPDELAAIAAALVAGDDRAAAESTLYLLVLDPLDPFALGHDVRARIAAAALESPDPAIRGLAAERLATSDHAELLARFDRLVRDADERVRGIVWSTALRVARADARDLALALLIDEAEPLPVRRSALVALGTLLPTSDLVDVLALLVDHPDPALALDAAQLMHQHHRHPTIALAAQASRHAPVRAIAEALLDPLRGSPAAGGSRPGDPTRADATAIYAEMVRQLEEETRQEAEGRRQGAE